MQKYNYCLRFCLYLHNFPVVLYINSVLPLGYFFLFSCLDISLVGKNAYFCPMITRHLYLLGYKLGLYWGFVVLCAIFLDTQCLKAQMYEGKRLVTAQLLTSSNNWAQPFYLAVYFKMAPEWHLYWKNAGDSGIPPMLSVQLPPNFEVGDVLFPTPHCLRSEGNINYTYEEELLLLLPIVPKADADTIQSFKATVYAEWLVCHDICLKGNDTLRLDSQNLTDEALLMMQKRISANLITMPKPLSDLGIGVKKMRFRHKKQGLYAHIYLSKAIDMGNIDFFPENINGYSIAFDAIKIKKNRQIIIPLSPEVDNEPLPQQLRGLLIVRNIGYAMAAKP